MPLLSHHIPLFFEIAFNQKYSIASKESFCYFVINIIFQSRYPVPYPDVFWYCMNEMGTTNVPNFFPNISSMNDISETKAFHMAKICFPKAPTSSFHTLSPHHRAQRELWVTLNIPHTNFEKNSMSKYQSDVALV